jgi:hypothetical protein
MDDCELQTFRAGGKGGQNQNKRESGVRIIHRASGARGESREERSQLQNKRTAFGRMARTIEFKLWLNRKLVAGPTPEEIVVQDMALENLRIEVREDNKWVVS